LANALFFLTSNPSKYQRLQKEVDEANLNGGDAPPIPYVDAVINETLRLKPPVPGGMSRVTPPEGLTIDEVFIPGNIVVISPQHVVQRDERNFDRALEFLPERWIDEGKEMHKDERAFFPFSLGREKQTFFTFVPGNANYIKVIMVVSANNWQWRNCVSLCSALRASLISSSPLEEVRRRLTKVLRILLPLIVHPWI
jgi:hypothetical protein